jgi:hypothetical protein
MGDLVRFQDRRILRTARVVEVRAAALAEAGMEISESQRLIVELLNRLGATPELSARVRPAIRIAEETRRTGRWLAGLADRGRAA